MHIKGGHTVIETTHTQMHWNFDKCSAHGTTGIHRSTRRVESFPFNGNHGLGRSASTVSPAERPAYLSSGVLLLKHLDMANQHPLLWELISTPCYQSFPQRRPDCQWSIEQDSVSELSHALQLAAQHVRARSQMHGLPINAHQANTRGGKFWKPRQPGNRGRQQSRWIAIDTSGSPRKGGVIESSVGS